MRFTDTFSCSTKKINCIINWVSMTIHFNNSYAQHWEHPRRRPRCWLGGFHWHLICSHHFPSCSVSSRIPTPLLPDLDNAFSRNLKPCILPRFVSLQICSRLPLCPSIHSFIHSFIPSFPSPPLPLSSAGRPSVWGGMWAYYVENYVIATKKRVSKEKDSQCMLLLIVTVLCSANGNKMERQAIAIVILN